MFLERSGGDLVGLALPRYEADFEILQAAIAQLGERQTEDLNVPGSIPGLGIFESCLGHESECIGVRVKND